MFPSHDHVANEEYYIFQDGATDALALEISQIGSPIHFKGIAPGQALEEVDEVTITPLGYDLFPYAPVQIERSESGGDTVFDWVRRTRVRGDLSDGTGTVPLEEDSEVYEMDILDAPGGNVVRTFTGLSTPTVTYTAAQKSTDSYVSGPIHGEVYQISGQVGRGFAGEFSL